MRNLLDLKLVFIIVSVSLKLCDNNYIIVLNLLDFFFLIMFVSYIFGVFFVCVFLNFLECV